MSSDTLPFFCFKSTSKKLDYDSVTMSIDLLALLDTLELQIVFGDLYDPDTGIYPYADDDDIIEVWPIRN